MLFQTPEFLLLAITVFVLYWVVLGTHKVGQNIMLLIASYFFYGWWDGRFLGLILFSTLVDYVCGIYLDQSAPKHSSEPARSPSARKNILLISLFSNLGLLGIFKYFDFFTESLASAVWVLLGVEMEPWILGVAVPVGISFYTFQSLSYTIDIYRGHLRAQKSFIDFALFVAFFPQLVAGPIVRAKDMLPQIARKRQFSWHGIHDGVWLIFWGLFKKTVIADSVGVLVDTLFTPQVGGIGSSLAIAATYAFTIQLYCDFSGYTDIARGVSRLLGFELPLNFRLPFFAINPSDFWQRWHITLSSWLRDYLYISLGGNRRGTNWTYFNLMATMMLGGLWHGANDNFVAWGIYHGLVLVLYRFLGLRGFRWPFENHHLVLVLRRLLMFHFWCVGCIIFRAASTAHAWELVTEIFSFAPANENLITPQYAFIRLLLFAGPLLFLQWLQFRSKNLDVILSWAWPIKGAIYAILFLGLVLFGNFHGQEFIYFQF